MNPNVLAIAGLLTTPAAPDAASLPPPPASRSSAGPAPTEPPGLSTDGYYLLISPGLLAFDIPHPQFNMFAWGLAGGRLFTGAQHFAFTAGGFFEHNLWVNRVNPDSGQHARSLSFIRLGPEIRMGASGERVFAYGLIRLGLDLLTPGPLASIMATAGVGIQGALTRQRRLLLGVEPAIDYSYPDERGFFRIRMLVGVRF